MRKLKLSIALLFVFLGAVGVWVFAKSDIGCAFVATEIVCQMRLEKGKTRRAQVDLSSIVAKYIPIGTTANAAREILEKNGFKIYKNDLHALYKRDWPEGTYTLAGTTTESSYIPIASYEYRIVLTIADGQVASVHAFFFLHTL